MDFYRIQDKIISWQRVEKTLRKALLMRSRGFSQQDAATRLGIDRTLISRVESIGELRKGQSVACLGFPILNKEEITEILQKEGVDFIMLMSERERLDFVEQRSGKELINEIMDLTARVRGYEVVVCIASDERLRMLEGMLDGQVIGLEIGESPLTEDKWVDPQEIRNIMKSIKAARRA